MQYEVSRRTIDGSIPARAGVNQSDASRTSSAARLREAPCPRVRHVCTTSVEKLAEAAGLSRRHAFDVLHGCKGTTLDACDRLAAAQRVCPLKLLSIVAQCAHGGGEATHARLRERLAFHLKHLRRARGCASVDAWARAMGVAVSTGYALLEGASNVRVATVVRVATALDVDMIELLACAASQGPGRVIDPRW